MKTKLCVNCFKDIDTSVGNGDICPNCGFDNSKTVKNALEYYSKLNDKYIVGRVISANSQGYTYIAYNTFSSEKVKIQEFFPTTLAYREGSKIFASAVNSSKLEKYYQEFIALAKKLPQANELVGFIKVLDVFLQNNTCYIVYENVESVSLNTYVSKHGGLLDYNTFSDLFIPFISTLNNLNNLGIKHLGISPQNLKVCSDGKLRLSDFAIESVRRLGTDLQVDLISGCPSYEQFTKVMPCGQASDVYSLCACMLFALTGKLPMAMEKRLDDPKLLIDRDVLKRIPPQVIKAISGGLQIKPENRISSFARLKLELAQDMNEFNKKSDVEIIKNLPQNYHSNKKSFHVPTFVWLIVSFVVCGVFLYNYLGNLLDNGTLSFDKIYSYIEAKFEKEVDEVTPVPNMVGGYYNDWVAKLKDSSVYKVGIEISDHEFSEEISEGKIISQSPEAGKTINTGETISVVVSQGSATRKLPTVIGMSYTKALELLEEDGFVVTKEERSSSVKRGFVLWYHGHYAGDELPYGSEIILVVSK